VSGEPLPRVTLFVAAGIAAVLVIGVIIVSQVMGGDDTAAPASTTEPTRPSGPLALVTVDAPDAGSASCTNLVTALPANLPSNGKELERLVLAEPAPPAAAAWAGDRGEPVVMRCGLVKPQELQPGVQLRNVDGVNWLPIEGDGATTWITVDRPVYIALTIPEDAGTGVVQQMSETIARAVPAAA
jgi:hypothetical protein